MEPIITSTSLQLFLKETSVFLFLATLVGLPNSSIEQFIQKTNIKCLFHTHNVMSSTNNKTSNFSTLLQLFSLTTQTVF